MEYSILRSTHIFLINESYIMHVCEETKHKTTPFPLHNINIITSVIFL